MTDTPDDLIDGVIAGRARLTQHQSADVFSAIMTGALAPDRIESFLVALTNRGETVDEIVGAASVMRKHATPIPCEFPNAIDTCGTGGDGISTFNVSTAAAIVAAAAGAKVAKHGNRSFTRKSGSAEVMAELGVNIDAPPAVVARCIREAGLGFLHAARLHPAMAHVAEIRRKIGRRTIFNLLGPLTNPAGVHRQIVGVPRLDLMERIAAALSKLGCIHAIVVCGDQGLCDFTVTGPSHYLEVRQGAISPHIIAPSDIGLKRAPLDALRAESPADSAAAIRAVLSGEHGPRRDHTLFNAAAALVVAGLAADLRTGANLAAHAIDDRGGARSLDALVKLSWEAE